MTLLVLLLLALNLGEPCRAAEDVPIGTPKVCTISTGGVCCTWRYVTDRYCTTEPDDDCTKRERADDAMNALRAEERWCYRFGCGWLLNGEGYYNSFESDDALSIAQRKVRTLIVRRK